MNGARQSSQLVNRVHESLFELMKKGALEDFPRVLAFQSVLDSTVFTTAVVDNLFAILPTNGSELVLFDRNRDAAVGPLVRPESIAVLDDIRNSPPGKYSLTVITGGASGRWSYPADMYSLSHVALPFPMDDALYGREPRTDEFYGVRLGNLAARGERGALVVSVDTLMRATCNPFFDYQIERIRATIE